MARRAVTIDPVAGTLNVAIPASALPASNIVIKATVANQAARYALTTASVQNGDYVYQTDTAILYEVTDQTALNGAGGYTALATVTAAQISDATAAGRTLLTAADAAAQRSALGSVDIGLAAGLAIALG